MACTSNVTVYWLGTSFASATQLFSDSNLTTVAPDGYYQVGGIYREMSGGVLGAPGSCPTCLVPCGNTITGSGSQGYYTVSFDAGNSQGAVIVLFQPFSFPDGVTWTYDGVSASEYSSSSQGYLQGLIGTVGAAGGNPPCNPTMNNATGSAGATFSGTLYVWDTSLPGLGNFVDVGIPTVLGPYGNAATGDVSFTNFMPGPAAMVVPKPNITPTNVDFVIQGPCDNTQWNITVLCPQELPAYQCEPTPVACGDPLTESMFTVHPGSPTGVTAGGVFVNDWAFADSVGVNLKPAGTYLVNSAGTLQCVTVSANGVVTNVTPCAGSC